MPIHFRQDAIIDSLTGGTHQWTLGTGSIGIFTQNGSTSENSRVYDTDPFGNTSIVWETSPLADNNADGGWETSYFNVDYTKLYRYSVWVQRISSTSSGSFYFGLRMSPTNPREVTTGNSESNPYWSYTAISNLTQDLWYLFVGFIYPHDYPHTYGNTTHPRGGYYTRASGRIGGYLSSTLGGGEAMFPEDSSSTVLHRTYHFYSTSTAAQIQFFDPRIDLCDGSEPTIQDLLNGTNDYQPTILGSLSLASRDGFARKARGVHATGGDEIFELGELRVHMFTSSGTFELLSYPGDSVKVEYLIVAGGGGGGTNMGGGGGGGGAITGYTYLTGNTYTITVGGGGAGAPAGTGGHPNTYGNNGSDSTFNGLTASGGGAGGLSPNTFGQAAGLDGGCGGGASGYNNGGTPATGGSGTVNQGYDGGDMGSAYYSGGGGGAGSEGASGNNKANGGNGKISYIMGRPYYWGGGGGGAGYSIHGGDGGKGGGGGAAPGGSGDGNGGTDAINWGAPGTPGCLVCHANVPGGDGGTNSGGGGGGGAHYEYTNAGGDGGSGIVVLRYQYR